MRAGKDPAHEKWATIYNLKQMAAATDRFHSLSDSIKTTEAAMNVNAELKAAIVDHAKTRAIFEGYKAARYSKKYLAEHEADIATHRAARATMDRLLNGGKLPKMDTLKTDFQKLAADKKAAYRDYRAAKKDMQEVVTVRPISTICSA